MVFTIRIDTSEMAAPTKKILISQPMPVSGHSPYFSIAEKYGYEVEFRQLIKVVPVEAAEFRRQRVDILGHSAIIFTSKSAIDNFFALTKELRITIPEGMKYFCQSEAVALYLQKYIVYRKRKVFYAPNSFSLADMLTVIGKHAKETYFVPVAEDHGQELFDKLTEKKITFHSAVMYRTVTRDFEEPLPIDHDIILFFSPYGIRSVKELYPNFEQGDRVVGSFGSLTTESLKERGIRVDFTAPTPECPSMVVALEKYLSEHAE